jgi:two-component system OmpR family response regulator
MPIAAMPAPSGLCEHASPPAESTAAQRSAAPCTAALPTAAPVATPVAAAPAPGRILLVAAHAASRDWLAHGLQRAGHAVHCVADPLAIASAAAHGFALLLICPPLQAGGGPDFADDCWWQLRALRRAEARLPVIVLLPDADSTDRTLALELGADAVLDGDCQPRELRARVASLLHRRRLSGRGATPAWQPDGWLLDAAQRRVQPPGAAWVTLTTTEYRLLRTLLQQPGRTFSRDELLDGALRACTAQLARSVDLLVSRLRRRLGDDPVRPQLIRTVRGQGYRFTPAPVAPATCGGARSVSIA